MNATGNEIVREYKKEEVGLVKHKFEELLIWKLMIDLLNSSCLFSSCSVFGSWKSLIIIRHKPFNYCDTIQILYHSDLKAAQVLREEVTLACQSMSATWKSKSHFT